MVSPGVINRLRLEFCFAFAIPPGRAFGRVWCKVHTTQNCETAHVGTLNGFVSQAFAFDLAHELLALTLSLPPFRSLTLSLLSALCSRTTLAAMLLRRNVNAVCCCARRKAVRAGVCVERQDPGRIQQVKYMPQYCSRAKSQQERMYDEERRRQHTHRRTQQHMFFPFYHVAGNGVSGFGSRKVAGRQEMVHDARCARVDLRRGLAARLSKSCARTHATPSGNAAVSFELSRAGASETSLSLRLLYSIVSNLQSRLPCRPACTPLSPRYCTAMYRCFVRSCLDIRMHTCITATWGTCRGCRCRTTARPAAPSPSSWG